jgi:acyl-CoA dehydrogenase
MNQDPTVGGRVTPVPVSDELRAMAELVGRFVRERIRPAEDALPADARELPHDVLDGLRAQARPLGLWCFDTPAEHGGAGLSVFETVVVLEEAVKHKFCFPHAGGGVFGHPPPVVLFRGTPEQVERWARPVVENGWRTFTAIAEPSGGTDPKRAIRTTAVRKGDVYVINGRKQWITNADRAHFGVVYARTDEGISAFVVDGDAPGISTTPMPVLRNHWPVELVLEDVEVPVTSRIGPEGAGLGLAAGWLVRQRLSYAARAVGIAEEAVRMAVEWLGDRETFGAPLATRQGPQFDLAKARAAINAGRWLTWEAAWIDDAGGDARPAAALAKLHCVEMAFEVVDRVMQWFGALGMAKELPLEHWFRDLRVARIVEGASEILQVQIARQMLGPVASGRSKA